MSLKAMREQNDISIIIGNLPKRLQMKIAENCYSANNNIAEKAKTSASASTATVAHVNCESKAKHGAPKADKQCPHVVPKRIGVEDAGEGHEIIPGILRVQPTPLRNGKTTKTTAAVVGEDGSSSKSRVVTTKKLDVAALSPARQLSKVAATLPSWCALNNAPSCVRELPQLHAVLIDLMKRNVVLQNWDKFNAARQQLQQLFAKLLLQHLKFCCEQKVDTFFWKLLFYNVREHLKEQMPVDLVQQYLLSVFKDGLSFYENLHEQLVAKYLVVERNNSADAKYEFIAKVMAQKLLICLGDLCRYKAKQLQCNDLSEAANYYQRAQLLIPSNGIPYNQLAIVSIQSRKKFDAVYYHMRSLMASNAIYSARESLLVLFDEIRKKYEESDMKKSPKQQLKMTRHGKTNDKHNGVTLRKEIWLHAEAKNTHGACHCNDFRSHNNSNGMGRNDHLTPSPQYDEMNHEALVSSFVQLYLYVIGILYNGIGMENMAENQYKLCAQFNSLLQRKSLMGSLEARKRLLKILALNIFIMEQNKNHDTRRYQAFLLANKMFALLLGQCNRIHESRDIVEDMSTDDLQNLCILLKYVHLYTVWLARNYDIWQPLRQFDTDYNCWQELNKLLEHIRKTLALKNGQLEVYARATITLDEESFLAGFTPLFDTRERTSTAPRITDKSQATEIAQFYARLVKIANFEIAYKENCERLQLEQMPQEREFDEIKYILQTMSGQAMQPHPNAGFKKSKSATELLTQQGCNEAASLKENKVKDDEMLQLSKLKRELEAKTNVKRHYSAQLEEILNYVDTKLYIEVRPKYLLPDTNCFIDSIDDFEALIREFKCYTLIVPLTVVKELDGLSKGFKIDAYEKAMAKDRIHHYDDVSTRAKKSLEFIKNSKNQVKCATTKGSIINSSMFALVEEEYVSNDDKILATAVALSKTFGTENSAGGRCFMQTELVLITTDRNLRVKALTRKLAVSNLSEFMQWNKNMGTN